MFRRLMHEIRTRHKRRELELLKREHAAMIREACEVAEQRDRIAVELRMAG